MKWRNARDDGPSETGRYFVAYHWPNAVGYKFGVGTYLAGSHVWYVNGDQVPAGEGPDFFARIITPDGEAA